MLIVSLFIVYRINYTGIKTIEKQLVEQSNSAHSHIIKSIFQKDSDLNSLDPNSIHNIIRSTSFTSGGIKLYNSNKEIIGTSNYIETELLQKDYNNIK